MVSYRHYETEVDIGDKNGIGNRLDKGYGIQAGNFGRSAAA